MKQKLVCVFAHPDDEAFGPGGTIAKLAQDYEVYILCATRGEAGEKNGEHDIGKTRSNELLESSHVLGVKKVFFLGFTDGQLCNSNYHDLANKIKQIVKRLKPEILLTFEPRGVSGHIDHITVSMVTTYIFEHLSFVKKILYYCHTDWQVKIIKTFLRDYFVYFPPGYKSTEIGLTVDIKPVWNIKEKAMRIHKSQIHDVNRILTFLKLMPKKEYFLVLKK